MIISKDLFNLLFSNANTTLYIFDDHRKLADVISYGHNEQSNRKLYGVLPNMAIFDEIISDSNIDTLVRQNIEELYAKLKKLSFDNKKFDTIVNEDYFTELYKLEYEPSMIKLDLSTKVMKFWIEYIDIKTLLFNELDKVIRTKIEKIITIDHYVYNLYDFHSKIKTDLSTMLNAKIILHGLLNM